jgi:FkbM family methyltransferase
MKYFLDFGAHKLEGLQEFTEKLNINSEWNVHSYEPNIFVLEETEENAEKLKNNYKSFTLHKKAVMNENGYLNFNSHRGSWKDGTKSEYIPGYTTGGNVLDFNPQIDIGNNVVFDNIRNEVECIDVEDILENICKEDSGAEIYIKCDIEGSEFAVLPRIIDSKYAKHIKKMYIEWHERMWYCDGQEGIQERQKERVEYTTALENIGIECYVHH